MVFLVKFDEEEAGMHEERVGAYEAKTHFSDYLNRVRYRGERIVIERHGKPVAALVGMEDLKALEAAPEDPDARRYRRALAEAGVEVSYPTGNRVPRKRRRIKVKGKPLSEQIVEDRR